MEPIEIERNSGPKHSASALFGYISGLPDAVFLSYILRYRDHAVVRRVFFSEIEKRTNLSFDVVDQATAELLAGIAKGVDRAKNEALLRCLIPRMSMQMRTQTARTILSVGTKVSKSYVLRWVTAAEAPGIESLVVEFALHQQDQDALVGIVYRWPVETWKDYAEELFKAASAHPWLQRQIIFRSNEPDTFLDQKLITDPVTELYIRARYGRPVSTNLMESAIETVNAETTHSYETSQRSGLIAWCLGRLGAFDRIPELAGRSPPISSTASTKP
jgi:hypothetical protein